MSTLLTYAETDVNQELARIAHLGTSFVPEKRAQGVVDSYMSEMSALVEKFEAYVTDENRQDIADSLEYYRQGYLKRLHSYLSAHSRVLSPMITGPSNFPTRRNEKRWATVDKRREEWLDWCKKTQDRLYRTYNPHYLANAPVSSDDPAAIKKLRAKLADLERSQEFMKAANKVCRSKKSSEEEKVTELINLGMGEGNARALLFPDWRGVGFPRYTLTNNNANILRIKRRIAELEQRQTVIEATEENPVKQYPGGIELIENLDENRIQIIFPGKPEASTRQLLKSNGFRWAPSQGAWQRHLNANGKWAADRVLKEITETQEAAR